MMRPLQNGTFSPISALGSNFNPRNIQYIPACPVGPEDPTGVVEIVAFLEREQKLPFFKGLMISSPPYLFSSTHRRSQDQRSGSALF
jgi:hypothetical protein